MAGFQVIIYGRFWAFTEGLTTRNYPLVTRSFAEAYGIEKSAISERFIQASREKLKTLMERPLSELRLCAIVIDGTPFKGRRMIAAIGVAHDGKKTVLGLRGGKLEVTQQTDGHESAPYRLVTLQRAQRNC